ncbi:MAG: O-antigen ligase family protein [Candidatus Taylorbacteria bacterium]|nr:O-antigen ligase family protein [Candidatus Taylorbacteria bacterium]
MSKISLLNKLFVLELVLFGLIITGLLPRETVIFLAIGLVIYMIMAPIEDATIFFVRSIPLFIAIPITANYDNLNTWRILSIILFLKLAHITGLKYFLNIKEFSKYSKLLLILFVFAVLSIIPAVDRGAAVTRIIYFVNLSLIGMVVYYLVQRDTYLEAQLPSRGFTGRLIKNIAIPTIIVTVVGFIQLASTYFIDIYQFMRIWGEGIQMRQFGVLWSEIAVRLGNTWFAYYGDQLSLRVFSLFPDSHSFPQFVLLGLPAIFAVALLKITNHKSQITNNSQIQNSKFETPSLLKMIRTRANMSILWIPAMFLIIILSGTRGIWAASVGVLIVIFIVFYWLKKEVEPRNEVQPRRIALFKYISLYMLIFFLLFAVAYPIFVSPQFLLSKEDWGLFGNRIRSIIDFGETSNSQRIEIWKASLESIKQRPLLGVGIGNFPVVLDQRIFLARAGSSAHNIYLHIAAEMGILALVTAVWFLWLVFKKSYENFVSERDPLLVTYFGATILFVPWVLIYSLTDVALFDERAFLLFVTTIALILANKNLANTRF